MPAPTNNMGNENSKPRRGFRRPKINIQPDEIVSVSDSCLPNSVDQMGATRSVELQGPLPEIDGQLGITSISDSCLPKDPNSVSPMGMTNLHRPLPKINFRVLIIGRANAGKTSILQRVCDTTDSPVAWRGGEEVHSHFIIVQV